MRPPGLQAVVSAAAGRECLCVSDAQYHREKRCDRWNLDAEIHQCVQADQHCRRQPDRRIDSVLLSCPDAGKTGKRDPAVHGEQQQKCRQSCV